MGYFEFPHTRTYDNDLGWLIWAMKKLIGDWENFSNLNSIKFADPINWTIDRNYEPAMIVVDAEGNGYISRKAVPAGVPLSNEDYWTQIFNFGDITETIRSNIAYNNRTRETLQQSVSEGDLIWWNGDLYNVLYDLAAGTQLIEGTNVQRMTVNEKLKIMEAQIQDVIAFEILIDDIRTSIAPDEEDNVSSTHSYSVGDLLWWNNIIYMATADIPSGGALTIGANIVEYTVDEKINSIYSRVQTDIERIGETDDSIISGLAPVEANTEAAADHTKGSLIWWNNGLYIVTQNIHRTDTIENGVNVTPYTINEKIEDVASRLQKYFGERSNWVYVDGTNGNDSNIGDQEHPFKTIERALEETNNGYANLSIGILTAGTYAVDDYNNLTYLSLHIYSYAPNVIIDFPRTDFTTYGLHLNLHGVEGLLTITADETGFHFESGQLYAQNVYFHFPVRIIGTQCHFRNCQFDSINTSESNIVFNEALAFHNAENVAVVFRQAGGVTSFYQSSITLDEAPDAGVTFIQVQAGVVCGFQNANANFQRTLTNKYEYGIRLYNAVCAIYPVRINEFKKIAATPYSMTAGTITSDPCMFGDVVDLSGYSSANPYSIGQRGYVNIYNSASSHNGVLSVSGNQGGNVSIGFGVGRYAMPVYQGMTAYVAGTFNFARFIPLRLADD